MSRAPHGEPQAYKDTAGAMAAAQAADAKVLWVLLCMEEMLEAGELDGCDRGARHCREWIAGARDLLGVSA